MAAEPGCQRGRRGGGGRSRPDLQGGARTRGDITCARKANSLHGVQAVRLEAAVVGDPWWPQVGCGAVEVFVRCNPASSREDAGRARHRPALRSASVVVAREGVSAAALACDAALAQQRAHTTS